MRNRYVVALLTVVTSVAGCSGESSAPVGPRGAGSVPEPAESARVEVTEAGYVSGQMYAFVRNDEDREVAAVVRFTAFDEAGTEVKESAQTKSEDQYDTIPPKSTIAVVNWIVLEGGMSAPDPVRVEASIAGTRSAEIPEHQPGKFTAGPVNLNDRSSGRGSPEISVEITNGYPQAVKSAVLALVCRDVEDKISSVASTQFSAAAGATVRETFTREPAPTDTTSCVAYPRMMDYTSFK